MNDTYAYRVLIPAEHERSRAVLARVGERLATRDTWTTRASARNVHGSPVSFNHPNAVCWCLSGAVQMECQHESSAVLRHVVATLVQAIERTHPSRFTLDQLNDRADHAAVRGAIEEGMALCHEEQCGQYVMT